MASQPPAPRQWFLLPSIVRGPSPPLAPTPEPPAPQPRPPMVRAPFRPMAMPQLQQTQPQYSSPAPAFGASSVATSPIRRTSVPSSPVPRTSPPPTMIPANSSPSLNPPASPPKPAPTIFLAPTSPPKPAVTNFYVQNSSPKPEPAVTAITRVPTPTPSPRTIKPADKTPPLSPYNNPTAPPPSPSILTPPQLKSKPQLEPTIPKEPEQKTVLVQTTSEKPKSWLNGAGNRKDFEETHNPISHGHHGNHEVHKEHHKKFSSDPDHKVGMKVITISGENKGAFMEVIKSPLKHSFDGNSHNLYKTKSHGTEWKSFSSSSSSSDEGKSKKDKNHKAKAMHSPPMGAFMNSNVQSVNNSIVLDSSCFHHDPGVHLSLSRKPSGNGFRVRDKSNGENHG